MLHAYTWSFNGIEKAIPQIAAAGFNSIQISPVNKTKGNSPWWILYQPCDLKIGNVVLDLRINLEICAKLQKTMVSKLL